MKSNYEDIVSRIKEGPVWYDQNGMRYTSSPRGLRRQRDARTKARVQWSLTISPAMPWLTLYMKAETKAKEAEEIESAQAAMLAAEAAIQEDVPT